MLTLQSQRWLCNVMLCCAPVGKMGGDGCNLWSLASLVVVGSLGGVGPVVGSSLGSLVVDGRWVVVRRYSSLGCTIDFGYGRGGGCAVVIVVPVVVVSAMVVVTIFFLGDTCRFKDTGWVSLFEAGKMRENGP